MRPTGNGSCNCATAGSYDWTKERMISDLRYALRMLLKSPGFSLVAVITLALGIGANTAIFSVVEGTLLRPLPFPNADRLVRLYEATDENGARGTTLSLSEQTFRQWREFLVRRWIASSAWPRFHARRGRRRRAAGNHYQRRFLATIFRRKVGRSRHYSFDRWQSPHGCWRDAEDIPSSLSGKSVVASCNTTSFCDAGDQSLSLRCRPLAERLNNRAGR